MKKRHFPARIYAAWLIAASLIWTPAAFAYQNLPYPQQPDESDLDSHGHYTNRDGDTVHAPARSRSGNVPAGATAQCRDGSYSFSRHHSGTCSRHGGVARWQ
ncbi:MULTISPECIES: DUF3761 domain-containing protein [unclassified Caballeronia]|uniref:DUF3761 domain-containing protein n=1 Tax=unclassified Caballeronia TaxID=2646786 RepID=UPI0028555D8C|nr:MULTISPECIES: DUF3761 domain-containing protein [unclassified Caballeronia]MDR5821049.1 DUF3761 domain-containing protein [Caballeronia sp. LZ043]MDR5879204.1 DUF3761 domain-containing protein [Caballeronia sp. LZ032]